jgi:hypothetical protein
VPETCANKRAKRTSNNRIKHTNNDEYTYDITPSH